MQPQAQTPKITVKKPSTKPSITGAILSVLALILSAIGSALVNSKYKSETPVTTTEEKVGEVVASGTHTVLASIFSIPFIAGAVFLALLAILFTILRLRKVKTGGLLVSVLWIVFSVWAIKIAYAALMVMKADPAS